MQADAVHHTFAIGMQPFTQWLLCWFNSLGTLANGIFKTRSKCHTFSCNGMNKSTLNESLSVWHYHITNLTYFCQSRSPCQLFVAVQHQVWLYAFIFQLGLEFLFMARRGSLNDTGKISTRRMVLLYDESLNGLSRELTLLPPWRKWQPFHRLHVQTHFLERK